MRVGNVNYISLTDIAKYQNSSDPSFTVKNWLRRITTINYVGLWKKINNENFNLVEFDQIKTEFERLKTNEAYQHKIEWSATRLLSKVNYVIHTDEIRKCIVPNLTKKQKQFIYAEEADVLNVALFGMTAKEWIVLKI